MHSEAVSYQTDLLTELIEAGEAEGVLSTAEAEQLRTQITAANSGDEITHLWTELEHSYGIFDEEKWST